jgi:hypothetical protein
MLIQAKTTEKILAASNLIVNRSQDGDIISWPNLKTIQLLNQTATKKLWELVRRSTTEEPGWQGYGPEEIIATKELLNRDTVSVLH